MSNKLEQSKFKLEKILGFRNMQEKLENKNIQEYQFRRSFFVKNLFFKLQFSGISHNTAISLQPIQFLDKIRLILYQQATPSPLLMQIHLV